VEITDIIVNFQQIYYFIFHESAQNKLKSVNIVDQNWRVFSLTTAHKKVVITKKIQQTYSILMIAFDYTEVQSCF